MPEITAAPAAALPLFFKRIVGVDPSLHGTLRLDRNAGFRFAAETQFVPLGLSEIEAAANDYPVLFTTGAEPIPVALLGLQHGSNLFLQADGEWQRDCYVPACVRAFPFVFMKGTTSDDLFLGMEPNADCLRSDSGDPLFEDGKPSTALNDAIAFGAAYRQDLIAAALFAHVLDAAGVLDQQDANITFVSGVTASIRAFKMLNRERLQKVNDETFLDWRRSNWIPPLYAHLLSVGRWRRLMDLAASKRPGTSH